MSRTSYHDGESHEKRISKHRVPDGELFDYALRVAYLGCLIQPKPLAPRHDHQTETRERGREQSRMTSLYNSAASVVDLFKDTGGGSKGAVLPRGFLKSLERELESISMGRVSDYSGQLIRRTMAAFYGQLSDEVFRRRLKNGRIEDLITKFASTASSVLAKDKSLEADQRKREESNQIAIFVKFLQDQLRGTTGVSTELTQRLAGYAAQLAPQQKPGVAYSDSGYDSSSTNRDRDSVVSPNGITRSIVDMPLVLTVARLFKISEYPLQGEIDKISKFCTEKAALTDLKTCLKNLNAGSPFPGRREDFKTEAAFQHWRTLETSHLSQLMVVMVQFNPGLAKSTPGDLASLQQASNARPTSIYSVVGNNRDSTYKAGGRNPSTSSRDSRLGAFSPGDLEDLNVDEDLPVGHHYTYIPPNPKKFYKRLLELCLIADLEAMLSPTVGDEDEVSLGILTEAHIQLINECALRWRIGQPYRVSCFLELIRQFYERNEVPIECVPEALANAKKVQQDLDLEKWPIQDSDYLANVYGSLYSVFLGAVYNAFEAIPQLGASELEPYIHILESIQDHRLLQRFEVDIQARVEDVKEQVKISADAGYHKKFKELESQPGVNRALPLLFVTDEIEKWVKKLDKAFKEPVLGKIDVVALVVDVLVPLFLMELDASSKRLWQDSMNGPTPDVPIEDLFSLYRRTKVMMNIYHGFCPNGDVEFDVGGFFEPYVRQWLVNTDDKTTQWVQAAIAADKFEAEGDEGHSSSIVDLFDSLRSPINFLQGLEWSDEYQEGRFFTSLSKTISKAIENYCRSIEELFMAEMFPRPTDYLQPQKSSAWIEKAVRLTSQGDKKVEPFNFLPETCVKLNNTDAARRLLDNMYNQMGADKIAEVLSRSPPVPDKRESEKFLFTVKICFAEGLVPLDSNPAALLDTFATLSNEGGQRLAKTRTVYETLNPRWDETFDLSIDKPLWLMVGVRDRALVGKHDTVGKGYICLDPRRFADLLPQDIVINLEEGGHEGGRVLLRVSVEGEKDEVGFYFGRAFRWLKRAESEMVKIFVDKMSPMISQSLSRSVVKSLIKSTANTGTLDYKGVLGNVKGFLGGSSSEAQVPPPPSEGSRARPGELTDVEIEQAIVPLFDYFDANLQTLNTHLSDATKEQVMARVWKGILITIEGLLIPPLSENPSEMKPLSDKEVDIVFKWLKFLRDYFYAGGEGPVPLETLQNQKYRDVVSIRLYYDWHTDALMEEYVRLMQNMLRSTSVIKKRAKSVYHSKNLGTIKDRKQQKQQTAKEDSNGEIILRILRMRSGTSDFIVQQLATLRSLQAEQEARGVAKDQRKLNRPRQGGGAPLVPPLPPALPAASK